MKENIYSYLININNYVGVDIVYKKYTALHIFTLFLKKIDCLPDYVNFSAIIAI